MRFTWHATGRACSTASWSGEGRPSTSLPASSNRCCRYLSPGGWYLQDLHRRVRHGKWPTVLLLMSPGPPCLCGPSLATCEARRLIDSVHPSRKLVDGRPLPPGRLEGAVGHRDAAITRTWEQRPSPGSKIDKPNIPRGHCRCNRRANSGACRRQMGMRRMANAKPKAEQRQPWRDPEAELPISRSRTSPRNSAISPRSAMSP
jgi:hypothetical protein